MLLGGAAGVVAVAAGAVAGVETGLLPGKVRLDRELGIGDVDTPVPDGPVGPVRFATFASRACGKDVTWGLVLPRDVPAAGLPTVVVLHGRGGNAHSAIDVLHLDAFLAQHLRSGGAPLAFVSADGTDRYWHPRAAGDDPLSMVVGEVLPLAARAGLRTDRIGVMGYSMGGFGALMMARQSERGALHGTTVVAAAASSPALFPTWESSARGAFDDRADWERWGDLLAHPGVRRTPLSVSCGTSDPFTQVTRTYRERAVTRPEGRLSAGQHTGGYWRSLLPDQLRFLAQHLT
ncbi:iron-stress inducible esterase [Angustibacter peucedani]